jgi:hypothetical protein
LQPPFWIDATVRQILETAEINGNVGGMWARLQVHMASAPPKTGEKHKVLKAQENLHGQTSQFIAESTSLSPLNRTEANSALGF